MAFSDRVTLSPQVWLLAAHPGFVSPRSSIPLNSSALDGKWSCLSAFSDDNKPSVGPTGVLCLTSRKVQSQLEFSILHIYGVLVVLGLYILHVNNSSCPCCLQRNAELSRVNIIIGWQDAVSMLSLAFPCWRKTLAAICPRWEMFYTWRSCLFFYQ